MPLAVAPSRHSATPALGRCSSRRISSCAPSCRAHPKSRVVATHDSDFRSPPVSDTAAIRNAPLSNPHRSGRSIQKSRPPQRLSRSDFVPWRFSDAGRLSAWMGPGMPASENLHMTGTRARRQIVIELDSQWIGAQPPPLEAIASVVRYFVQRLHHRVDQGSSTILPPSPPASIRA